MYKGTYGFASSEKVSVCLSVRPGPDPASVAHKINSFISAMASLSAGTLPQYAGLKLQAAGLLEGQSYIDSTAYM
jgi:hypothetical protein